MPHAAKIAQRQLLHAAKSTEALSTPVRTSVVHRTVQPAEALTTSKVSEGLTGHFSVTFLGRKKPEIETLKQTHLRAPEEWAKIKNGVTVAFLVKANKRGIQDGSVRIVEEEKQQPAFVSTIGVKADLPWICPNPECSHRNDSWDWTTQCAECGGERPKAGKDVGIWTIDKEVKRLKPVVWICPGCTKRNPEYLKLSKCLTCERDRPKGNGRTSFWVRPEKSRVYRFVQYEYVGSN